MQTLIMSLYNIALKGAQKDDPLKRKLFSHDERNFLVIQRKDGSTGSCFTFNY